MKELSLETMIQTLFMAREDLLQLHAVNPELCREALAPGSLCAVGEGLPWSCTASVSSSPLRAPSAAPHLCGGNLAASSGAVRTICKQSVSYRVLGRSAREERSVRRNGGLCRGPARGRSGEMRAASAGSTPTRVRGCKPWGWLDHPSRPCCPRHLTGVSPGKFCVSTERPLRERNCRSSMC